MEPFFSFCAQLIKNNGHSSLQQYFGTQHNYAISSLSKKKLKWAFSNRWFISIEMKQIVLGNFGAEANSLMTYKKIVFLFNFFHNINSILLTNLILMPNLSMNKFILCCNTRNIS